MTKYSFKSTEKDDERLINEKKFTHNKKEKRIPQLGNSNSAFGNLNQDHI